MLSGAQHSGPLPDGTPLQNRKYIISRVLGAGGFGITYLARDSSLGRWVAVKELFPNGCERHGTTVTVANNYPADRWDKAVEMFLREAVVLAGIDHPGVVPIYEYFHENNTAYIVMKFIDGKPLNQIVAESGPVDVNRASAYILTVAEALEVVHQANVLHRDIKPSNIIVTARDRPVLIDFGAARQVIAAQTNTPLTSIGTTGFAPAEQFVPQLGQGPQTDVYGLAATLFYLLTGSPPNLGPVDTNRLSEVIRKALTHALMTDPAQRTQTVADFVAELQGLQSYQDSQMFDQTQVVAIPARVAQPQAGLGRPDPATQRPLEQSFPTTATRRMDHYQVKANGVTPALIIYLLDVSASMNGPLGNKRRIEVVADALDMAVRQMVFRSTRGSRISPRYRLAIYAYSNDVTDLLGGIKSVSEVALGSLPGLTTRRTTETALAFTAVERLLLSELAGLKDCPAPLVCHMTDGEYTGPDPAPIVRRIRDLAVPDGNVLVENIFISDAILARPIGDPHQWPGILPSTKLENEYARKLQDLSSPMPESYRIMMQESNYHLAPGALMLLPGISPELVTLGFQMSAATPIR